MDFRPRLPNLAAHGTIASVSSAAPALAVVVLNQFFNVAATAAFAISGQAETVRTFILWQIIGGLFGLGTQVTFAGLVRYSSVGLANAIGNGLAFVSIQIFSAYLLFHEPFTAIQWTGAAFIFIGIVLIALGH